MGAGSQTFQASDKSEVDMRGRCKEDNVSFGSAASIGFDLYSGAYQDSQ